MSRVLEGLAEAQKVARLLGVDESEVSFLAGVTPADVRTFREAATDRLYDDTRRLPGLGVAAALIPPALVATITERAFGPVLTARIAGSVPPARAIDVASRLPSRFLAETSIHFDPRRVAPIIAGVPVTLISDVARNLGELGEYVTMGRFLGYLSPDAIAPAMEPLSEEALLRTAFVLEHKERLDEAIGHLPPVRLAAIVRHASQAGLWPEALDLLSHVADERLRTIAAIVDELGDDVLADILQAAVDLGMWNTLVPLVEVMSSELQARVAALVTTLGDEDLTAVLLDAVRNPASFPTLMKLVMLMQPEEQARITLAIQEASASGALG